MRCPTNITYIRKIHQVKIKRHVDWIVNHNRQSIIIIMPSLLSLSLTLTQQRWKQMTMKIVMTGQVCSQFDCLPSFLCTECMWKHIVIFTSPIFVMNFTMYANNTHTWPVARGTTSLYNTFIQHLNTKHNTAYHAWKTKHTW